MTPIAQSFPYSDVGSLFGGVRRRIAEILGSQAIGERQLDQTQDVAQDGRAFSGAQVTNDLTQTEKINQTATAENTKTIVIDPADTDGAPDGFNFNFLNRTITQINAGNFLNRGTLNLNQRQRASQSGFAKLNDFNGNPSTVTNTVTQDNTGTTQTVTTKLNTSITARRDPETLNEQTAANAP